MDKNWIRRVRLSSFQVILLGFLALILGGTLLLMLPWATRDGRGAPPLDALFTATSASCVTGLVVHDTATYWSGFGHFVILLLIQMGGLGIVTAALAVNIVSGRKVTLMQRSTMQESISAPKVGGIVRLTSFILRGTFLMELLGAAALLPAFVPKLGLWKGLWYSLFHSISAFCNAGFDLFGFQGEYSSLTSFVGNPLVNSVIMLLIVLGGLGFLTWEDVKTYRWKVKRYRMQTKVVLLMTALLILLPALYLALTELRALPAGQRLWAALFQSVTLRTAGFNTVDFAAFSEVGLLLCIMLMLVGGGPGSTAGGMKCTTVAVLLASAFAVFQRKDDAHLFRRRIPSATVKEAAAIFLLYVVLFSGGAMVISAVEGLPLLSCLFETASAIATVGLSLGSTPQLGSLSRLILIGLMYVGRVGGLTLIFGTLPSGRLPVSRYPQEKITIG